MKRCEQCSGTYVVLRSKYTNDNRLLCHRCRSEQDKAKKKVRQEAYRKKKKIINQRGQRCEACKRQTSELDLHHIQRLADGGENSNGNLQLVCKTCHKKIHQSSQP